MIKDNVWEIRERIRRACAKVGQKPETVNFVAVTKNRSLEQIRETLDAGIVDIGENKVQEASLKYKQFSSFGLDPSRITWHMVGHLQTNKVKEAVGIFDLIHSVDSLYLAQEIDKQAAKIEKVQQILLEVKTSPEETKFGLKPEDLSGLLREISRLKNISVKGLMTIAPVLNDPQDVRPYFRVLREFKDKINLQRVPGEKLNILSMGMTDDFEVAIEEGANMVRIGRAVFEGKSA